MTNDEAQGVTEAIAAWRRLAHAVRLSERLAERSTGLSGAQLFALRQLSNAPGCSLGELAELTVTHASSISVVVSRLLEKGLVTRDRDTVDARRLVLSVSPAGHRMLADAPESADHKLQQAMEALEPEARTELTRHLERLATAVRGDGPEQEEEAS